MREPLSMLRWTNGLWDGLRRFDEKGASGEQHGGAPICRRREQRQVAKAEATGYRTERRALRYSVSVFEEGRGRLDLDSLGIGARAS